MGVPARPAWHPLLLSVEGGGTVFIVFVDHDFCDVGMIGLGQGEGRQSVDVEETDIQCLITGAGFAARDLTE